MDRLACVELPALPLQILRRAHPEWSSAAVVVVERELPHAPILWVDERAARAGIVTGLSYAAAMARCSTLRAASVPAAQIAEQITVLTALLQRFSPHVEPSPAEAGIFWLDASGLTRLFSSLQSWGEELVTCLLTAGFQARVAIGFRRFASYAAVKTLARQRDVELESAKTLAPQRDVELESANSLAAQREREQDAAPISAQDRSEQLAPSRTRDPQSRATLESAQKSAPRSSPRTPASRHVLVLRDVERERALALELPLAQLRLPPRVRDELFLLDVRDVGALVRLDEHGLAARFGPELRALHRLAARELAPELDPVLERVPLSARVDFDLPEHALESLLAHVAELALALERRLSAAGRVLGSLSVRFELESPATTHVERIAPPGRSTSAATADAQRARSPVTPRPAREPDDASSADEGAHASSARAPAPQLDWLLRLLRLRLSSVRFDNGVHALEVELEGSLRAPRTGELFERTQRRDPLAARRAFDALRALFGDEVVVRARLVSAHLPEARFTWEKLTELTPPRSAERRGAQRRSRLEARDETAAVPRAPADERVPADERAPKEVGARPRKTRTRARRPVARGQTSFEDEGSLERTAAGESAELALASDCAKLATPRGTVDLAPTRASVDDASAPVGLEPARAASELGTVRDDVELAIARTDSDLAPTRDNSKLARARGDSQLAPARTDAKLALSRDDSQLALSRDDSKLALSRSGHLVRRILERPRAWKGGDTTLARAGAQGPYRISGGWWGRTQAELERDYYFVETHGGDLAWVFFDRGRDAWFLHGWIA